MNAKTLSNGIIRALLTVCGALLFLWFLYTVQSVIVYLIIAAVISLISRPFMRFFRHTLKMPNTIAVVITMSFFLILVMGLVGMFIPLVLKQGENLSLLNTDEFKTTVEQIFKKVNTFFMNKGIDVFDELKSFDLLSKLKNIPDIFTTIISGIGSLAMGLFSVLFISFFLLKDSKIVHNSFFAFIPEKNEKRVEKSINTIKELLSRYFLGLVMQITILFVIYTSVLLIFGIENAVVIAFICALLNLIPYIGPLIGGALMFILTITENLGLNFQHETLPTTMYVMLGYMIAQLVDNFFSQPIIFSKSVKSHPLEIFLIIVIGGLLFGITGMIVAVPCYTAIKVILKEFLSDNKIVISLTKDL
ncbi:AI-2E family transporter [Flavicella marina]|uniref:AI-2E family transporter n=1 Tax=Flavicella marina TaxID=1475951 RepID=UPI00126407B7|nr:AI-2E family transporter [Flavicella marina]